MEKVQKEMVPVEGESSGSIVVDDNVEKNKKRRREMKLSAQEKNELLCSFHSAVSSHDWELAESLILSADRLTMHNDLFIVLESSIWFLSTHQELLAILRLIDVIIAKGAYDFTTAAMRASFIASFVLAFQSQTKRTIPDSLTLTGLAQRWHEFLVECHGCEEWKGPAGSRFIHKCIECIMDHNDRVNNRSGVEIQLQLLACKMFLDLAGNQLASKDVTKVFYAACLPLKFFSCSFDLDPGVWATTAIPSLLGMLVEGGADNVVVNQCLFEASGLGNTELVCILLKVAQMNNLDVDVDHALWFASRYSRTGIVECLVEEGNVKDFKHPLMIAATCGCMKVVELFVKRGCQDMELCYALTGATKNNQVDVVAYLLPHIPLHLLAELSTQILEASGEGNGVNSLDGVAFLLQSDFLGDPASTYGIANSIAWPDDDEEGVAVAPELRTFLQEHWSEKAFSDGIRQGQQHYMNIVRILKRGESPICLDLLPPDLQVAIAYLPLYRECVNAAGGCLVSQRLRGQLVEAVRSLGGGVLDGVSQCRELLVVLEHRLTQFLLD